MPVYCCDALVLRTYRYGEADRIVVFLTQDRGKKRGVARHASRSRRRFGAALEPMTCGRATYMEHEGRELVRLDRVEPSDTPLRTSVGHDAGESALILGHASYFAELLDEWAQNDAPNERLFRLGTAVAAALGRTGGSVDVLARYFEYWLLRLEGVYPAIDRCPGCDLRFDGAVWLSAVDRAFLCRACRAAGPMVSGAALDFLRGLWAQTPGQAAGLPVAPGILRELEMAHHHLITLHLEKALRSSRVIKELGSPS